MVTHQMLLLPPLSLSLMSCNDSRLARSPVAVVSKAGAVGRDMQRHRGRRSVATAMASGARRRDRRHSAPDVLLKALRRRRSSALETLSASLHRAMAAVSVKQLERGARRSSGRVPTAKYTKMGETLRHVIPGHMQCSMACGGKACKYENPSRWSDEEQAVKGLYSSWITDNLLAMARPSTEIIEKFHVIEQFQRCGLKTVINLQRPGEHASCGNPLEHESGFAYRPETFMEAGIYYYNFGWKDYGVASLTTILDMVKVMSFAVQEGKMAVHCHAGLGRTGVLLACYLVFTSRMSADQAILFVRAKRPNSIQTRGQLLCVREFAQFLVPLRSVFSCAEPGAGAVTLSQYLARQRHLLHGYEARQMKNVPKVVHVVCALLAAIAADRQVVMGEERPQIPDLTAEVEKTVSRQALQQLGKEMRVKGIPVPPCLFPPLGPPARQPGATRGRPLASDNELDLLCRDAGSPLMSTLSNNRSLSDSVLHKLGPLHNDHFGNLTSSQPTNGVMKHSWSHSSLTAGRFYQLAPQDIGTRGGDTDAEQDAGSLPLREPPRQGHQSLPFALSEQGRAPPGQEQPGTEAPAGRGELPSITSQSELSQEGRRLLVAKALAMEHTDKEFTSKVSMWQAELNSREGAWERLRVERDPLVLSGLMWSWLEQLKDPIISSEDAKALSEKSVNPQNALDSLEKGHRLTLLCILDCAAHLLPMPEAVEARFLHHAIKVFTKMDPASEKSESLYAVLKQTLTPLLHELRDKAMEENEDS
uniref:protein tyrosine phosphatase domain-containing protein 1 isoform X2 n=1 Tax=Gasterosteus aculeatus aculeatus TaxID=481459 RepID=UPI001A98586C|nr:protein tyrosine phosphatase domain-containing protein 1 isoform X2 [Gasterosteus aculeatus aculeatus]XP_040059478.1 protein tyrosine phosphatase domain-containing protein 1 isoform X2 [Gasterosteus aculeatus aculeatus]